MFDEPLSNLDANLRGQMRTEIAQLHRQHGITTVYVTHDRADELRAAGVCTIGARPEDIELRPGTGASVQRVERLGAESLVHLEVAGVSAPVSVLSTDRSVAFGHPRTLHLPPSKLHRFDLKGQRLAA